MDTLKTMTYEVTGRIARIQQIDRAAKQFVLDALMMRQVQPVGNRRPFDVPFQSRPARKSRLARDGQLRIAEAERRVKNFRIARTAEPRMKLAEALRCFLCTGRVLLKQILRLMFQMIEIGMRG